ncbi:MAG: dockerin type I domain-containing protein [Phycisphaerales bacterium JB040]
MSRTTALTTLTLATLAGTAAAQPGTSWKAFLADQTGDGVVDAADYTVWRDSIGDFNRNGTIDAQDFNLWQSNYGQTGTAQWPTDRFDAASNGAPLAPSARLAWGVVPFPPAETTKQPHVDWIEVLSVFAGGLAGDYNDDGVVDAADFTVWRDNLGQLVSPAEFYQLAGDYNSDGLVDAADYTVWRSNHSGGVGMLMGDGSVKFSGDYNADGVVDAADYTVWRDNLASTFPPIATNITDWWWSTTMPCPADLNADGVLDNADIATFVQLFLAGDPASDLNGDGLTDNADIQAFVGAFIAGC